MKKVEETGQLERSKSVKPSFVSMLQAPDIGEQNLNLIVRNSDRNSFDFMEAKGQNLWEMTTFNYNR